MCKTKKEIELRRKIANCQNFAELNEVFDLLTKHEKKYGKNVVLHWFYDNKYIELSGNIKKNH